MTALPAQPQPHLQQDDAPALTNLKVITGQQQPVHSEGDVTNTIELMASNLGHQIEVYERLLDLARAQQDAIKQRETTRVHDLLQEIELAMMDRSRVDMQRTHIVATLAAQLGIPHDEVTVSAIADRTGADLSEQISITADHLRTIIEALDPIVTQNNALLRHELELIDGMVRMATHGGEESTYARPGSNRKTESVQLLDLQV